MSEAGQILESVHNWECHRRKPLSAAATASGVYTVFINVVANAPEKN